jgi:hypothetical protein
MWLSERKKSIAIAFLTFVLGAVGGKSFDAVWERVFPRKDLTGEILAVSKQGLTQLEATRVAILEEVRGLPEKVGSSSNPQEQVQRLQELVNNLAQVAGVLAKLNTTAVQVARGEEVSHVPRLASPTPIPEQTTETQVRVAPVPAPFVTGGVGGGRIMSPADQAAEMEPNLWVRMGETRRIAENPPAYLRIIRTDEAYGSITVGFKSQAWSMERGSFLDYDHDQGGCKLTYVTTRFNESRTDMFHGFFLQCTPDPTQPPPVGSELN